MHVKILKFFSLKNIKFKKKNHACQDFKIFFIKK